MASTPDLLRVVSELCARLDGDVSLGALADRSGWSKYHLHRELRRLLRETPKQYTVRLRLDAAASRLASGADTVLAAALRAGFSGHEVFARAFARRFGRTPSSYRHAMRRRWSADVRARHREAVAGAAPCLGLLHVAVEPDTRRCSMPTLSITRQTRPEQPVLFVRMRAARHEIATAIAEGAGKTFAFAQQSGLAIAGHPFTRYHSAGPGLLSFDVGIPLVSAGAGQGEIEAGTLPAGPVAVAIHGGPYDQLGETWAALERWIETNQLRAAAAPWEYYATDPAEHPNPADWRTEVCWPLAT